MEFLANSCFTENQNKIVALRKQGKTYAEIMTAMNIATGFNTTPKHISTCLTRSALGYPWNYEQPGGNPPFLCHDDMISLSQSVRSAHDSGNAMDTLEVLDEATKLKGRRIAFGIQFLREIGSVELSNKLGDKTLYTPSRSWINNVLDDLEAQIRSRRLIEQKRLEACSYTVIDSFYTTFGSIIQEVAKELLFTVDETMVETHTRRKAVLPIGVKAAIEEGYPNMPHISAMLCTNVYGIGPPPFIILNDLKRLPEELECYAINGSAWFASSPSGYMTRDVFSLWIICFINWFSQFKLSLPEGMRTAKALIILDGHSSRENPLALLLLRKANVEVIVLPSHTTHVLQMFDVGLAAPLKSTFAAKFKKRLKETLGDEALNSNMARFRRACISAFLDAWRCASIPSNCLSAAKQTGIFPFNPRAARDSPFVRDLTNEEQQRVAQREAHNVNRFTINMKCITRPEVIVELANIVRVVPRFMHLCDLIRYMTMSYQEIVREVLRMEYNDSYMLSIVPPFFRYNAAPIFFH